jgi:hypothetical protein
VNSWPRTGVVVDTFSYVFQSTDGATALTRGQLRSFKRNWAAWSSPRTGNLHTENIGKFLHVSIYTLERELSVHLGLQQGLTGVFDVKIYPTEFEVHRIIDETRDDYVDESDSKAYVLDTNRLNATLSKIDHSAVQKRRKLYRRLYHEARACCHPRRGLTFTETLTLLAHYKLIDDRESLAYVCAVHLLIRFSDSAQGERKPSTQRGHQGCRRACWHGPSPVLPADGVATEAIPQGIG